MAYTINLTDGTIFAVVADGTVNTDSSMTLVGKNFAGYGEFLNEDIIRLLENGANANAPGDPLTGQLWWDKTANVMKVYNGTTFKSVSGARSSASTPTSNVTGDLWWDTTNSQLKVYNGSDFITIGPAFTAGEGTSGAIVTTVTDSSPGADHVVVQIFVNNTIVGIWSKDPTFTPAVAIAGFATIGPGLNLSTTVSNAVFKGTATDAQLLDGLDSLSFMRTNTATSTTGTLSVLNDLGLKVGADSDGELFVTGSDFYIRNQTIDGDIFVQVNDGGATTTVMQVDGANATVGVTGITNLNANGVGNIGSTSSFFDTIHAKATSAEYADLAERFAADSVYPAGTVVQLGGVAEVTRANEELTDDVFGVVSTRAAFTMNGAAGNDATHPAIAMTGRVPVLVTGKIAKGDRLVSAGNGLARAARKNEITAFNVIGRALEDKTTEGHGTVEAIVKIN
jgi:hypothetical protein